MFSQNFVVTSEKNSTNNIPNDIILYVYYRWLDYLYIIII